MICSFVINGFSMVLKDFSQKQQKMAEFSLLIVLYVVIVVIKASHLVPLIMLKN